MDNNLNNGSGIPNVSDIKFDDTPAESFDNLYGGTATSNNNNANNGLGMTNNPNMAQPQTIQNNQIVNPTPVQKSNIGGYAQPNIGQQVTQPMSSNPQAIKNSQNINPTPVQQPNASVQQNTQIAQSTMNQNVVNPNAVPINNLAEVQQPNMTPNQGPIMTQNTPNASRNSINLSNVNIDEQRMQSIEEQLSKTSQYNPEDLQQEKITIPIDNQYEKNKSGLAFVIVLFIILAVVIAFLPQITKLIK